MAEEKSWFGKVLDGIADVAPTLVGTAVNIAVPGAGSLVEKMIRQVTGSGEDVPIEEAAKKLCNDPAAMVEMRRIAADKEVKLAQIAAETARKMAAGEVTKHISDNKTEASTIESVNKTMRVEAPQHKWSGMWRPFWGFCSAVAFVIIVIGFVGAMFYAIAKTNTDFINALPMMIMAIVALFGVPGAILGVASWHRGVQKRVESGEVRVVGKGAALIEGVSQLATSLIPGTTR